MPGEHLTRDLVGTPDAYRALYYTDGRRSDHGWLDSFGDAMLTELVSEAIQRNYNLAQSAAVRAQVLSSLRIARSALLPRLDALGTMERDEDSRGSEEILRLELELSWEADLWGRVRAGQMAAEQGALATVFEYEHLRQSLASLVAEAWFTSIAARRQMIIDLERVESEQETASVAASRAEAGAGELIANDFAQSNLAFAEELLAASESAYQESRRALELLLGRYPGAAIEATAELPDLPDMPAPGVPAELLERRPDLVAAEARVAAAFHHVQAARLARLPRLRLTAAAGTEWNPATGVWTLAADLFAPLFSGYEISAAIEVADARQRAAMAAYVETALHAFHDVESAMSGEMYLERRSRAINLALERLASANRRAEARYRAGVMTIFEFNQVRQNYFRAQSQIIAIDLDRLRQRLRLHLALGGSFEESFRSLDDLEPWIDRVTAGRTVRMEAKDE